MAKWNQTVGLIAIARDRDCGRIIIDADGEPVIEYTVSAFDARSVAVGVITAAECARAAGAVEIHVGGRGVEAWRTGLDWEKWKKRVEEARPGPYGSAHQMGSCRMAAREGEGTCDPQGRVRGVKGVWVADASVLPTSSGVNPMVTAMAVSRKVARELLKAWKAEGGKA